MRKNIFKTCCLLIILSMSQGFSQNKASIYKYNPPCSEITKLNPDNFVNQFIKNNKIIAGEFETGWIYLNWIDCKYKENITRLKNYPSLRSQLLQLRDFLKLLLDQEKKLSILADGDSEFHGYIYNVNQAGIESLISDLINLKISENSEKASATIKNRYKIAISTVDQRLVALRFSKNGLNLAKSKKNLEIINVYQQTVDEIKKLIGPKINNTNMIIWEFIALNNDMDLLFQ